MHRLVATVVVAALLSVSGSSALQHVHSYGDHDHADHHHGPAAHDHDAVAHPHTPGPTSSTSIKGCDPGAHAVSAVFTYVAPHPDHAPVPVAVTVFAFLPPIAPWRTTLPADVRAHSPPRITDAPLRAPPLVTPA